MQLRLQWHENGQSNVWERGGDAELLKISKYIQLCEQFSKSLEVNEKLDIKIK